MPDSLCVTLRPPPCPTMCRSPLPDRSCPMAHFAPITPKTVVEIFDIHLRGLLKLMAEQEMTLTMADDVKADIAMRGFDPQYGARQIIGNIRKYVRHPLSKLIIAGKIKAGDTVEAVLCDGEVEFKVVNRPQTNADE